MKQQKYQNNVPSVESANPSNTRKVLLKSWDDVLGKYRYYLLFSLIALIIVFIFKDFILLKKIYLFKDFGSDSINISYPSYYSLANYIEQEGIPKWLFSQGMGQNVFPAGLSDPFSLLIILMGKNLVYYSIFFVELLKIFCAGFFFHFFLKKINLSDYAAFIGAILYSFSGFVVLGGQWNIFSTQAVYIALLLYSFEKLYQDDSWILFPVAIFLIASHQPVDVYFIGMFLLFYILFRLLGDRRDKRMKISGLLTRVVLLGMTGLAVSALFFINGLQIMLESPRVGGDASYFGSLIAQPVFGLENQVYGKSHYLTALMRFFSCDILGSGSKFRGWYNYIEAPLFYCGLLTLVTFPHFLSLSDKRKKIIFIFVTVLFAIAIIFPFFRYSYWLYTGNYYRIFSFFAAIALILAALKSLDYMDAGNNADIKITAGTILVLLFILYYPYTNAQIINRDIRNAVAVFLVVYSLLIYLLRFPSIKNAVKMMLLAVMVAELIWLYNPAVNKRSVILGRELSQKIGYNDYTTDALAFVKSHDKTFFRVNKDYYSGRAVHEGLNDANAQEFYGTASYHVFNQLNYINFLEELGIIEKRNEYGTRWSRGLTKYPLLHSFASVKYALTREQNPHLLHFGYDLFQDKFGDVQVLKNKYALPLGFTYEKYIPLNDFKALPQNRKIITLYKAAVIDDSLYHDFGRLEKYDPDNIREDYFNKEYFNDIKLLSRNTLNISEQGQNKIRGTINVDQDKILFFSIPFDRGWAVQVDGKNIRPMMINIGFIGVPVEKGFHKIELSFTPVYFYTGAVISFMGLVLLICLIFVKYRRDRKTAAKA